MNQLITPVILCGGAGTRLWPLSRKSYPKQFATIVGDGSLFQQSAQRNSGVGFTPPVVVTNSDFRFIVTQQLSEVGIDPGAILIEPAARNTAPALLAAALVVAQNDPKGLILATPSDHFITDIVSFQASIQRAVPAATDGRIVTFGVAPDRPETGYGYLELGLTSGEDEAIPLRRFVEKPKLDIAQNMLNDGGFLWNAGVFLFSAEVLIDAFALYEPDLLDTVRRAVTQAQSDLGFLRLAAEPWEHCADVSVDVAIMERAENLSVVTLESDWSDLGGWEAVLQHSDADVTGVACHGDAFAVECSNSLFRAESTSQQVVGLGLDNVVVIAMPDAVLVADRSRVSELGAVVKRMRTAQIAQADTFPKDHRPWGFFETLTLGGRFQVKRIVVNPGAALSLQSHVHRSEHWIVVAGTARVTVDNVVQLVGENQSIYVPLGAVHRMENPGKMLMELIEVQTGSYLGEDDIVRYEDIYARGQGT